jgi:hypothetical protein
MFPGFPARTLVHSPPLQYVLSREHLQYMTAGCALQAIYYIVFLGWCFVPVYMASGVYTMPEYLRYKIFNSYIA